MRQSRLINDFPILSELNIYSMFDGGGVYNTPFWERKQSVELRLSPPFGSPVIEN